MRWQKTVQYLRERPYLLDSAYRMRRSEAEACLAQGGYASFAETVAAAKRRANLPDTAWAVPERVAKRAAKRAAQPKLLTFAAAHKRLAAALLILVFLTTFLTFTPPGRAFAASVFRMIAQTFGRLEIFENPNNPQPSAIISYGFSSPEENSQPTPVLPQTQAEIKEALRSFKEFSSQLCVLIGSDTYTIYAATFTKMTDGCCLLAMYYADESGYQVARIIQMWYGGDEPPGTATVTKDPQYFERAVLDGLDMFCIVDHDDNTFTGILYTKKQKVTITIFEASRFEDVLEMLVYSK